MTVKGLAVLLAIMLPDGSLKPLASYPDRRMCMAAGVAWRAGQDRRQTDLGFACIPMSPKPKERP